jgi:hypothetical protein
MMFPLCNAKLVVETHAFQVAKVRMLQSNFS